MPAPQRTTLIERIVAGTAATAFSAFADLLVRAVTTPVQGHVTALRAAAALLVEALPGDPARGSPPPWLRPWGWTLCSSPIS
ncbi:MAG: hypothetical protein M3Y41_01660 [Pseudomonadota bacterium]|nr:hypothetical protein [Pseudomonadota bacterium]